MSEEAHNVQLKILRGKRVLTATKLSLDGALHVLNGPPYEKEDFVPTKPHRALARILPQRAIASIEAANDKLSLGCNLDLLYRRVVRQVPPNVRASRQTLRSGAPATRIQWATAYEAGCALIRGGMEVFELPPERPGASRIRQAGYGTMTRVISPPPREHTQRYNRQSVRVLPHPHTTITAPLDATKRTRMVIEVFPKNTPASPPASNL
jgi:hypothetical protein